MKPISRSSPSRHALLLTVPALLAALSALHAQDADLPRNLGRGLRPLVEWQRAQPAARTDTERHTALVARVRGNRRAVPAQLDTAGNVTVDIRLTGEVAPEEVKKNLVALGLTVFAEYAARHEDGRDGMLSARLPLGKAVEASRVAGVQSVLLAHRPRPRAGKVPGQGLAPLHADQVQAAGFTGAGLTVGVLSDSYDLTVPHAAVDVASGDLPANVTVLDDSGSADSGDNTDEGRAMLQIVHDVAPDAKLAFSTVGESQITFAAAIRRLRTNAVAFCDVLVDDIGFSDEPFFSDSIIAEAVDDVVTSDTLPGQKVIYYSAAGNDGSASYAATFDPISDARARAGKAGKNNLKLDQVPAGLTGGGFHNFKGADVGHGKKIAQQITVTDADAEIDFQWDDAFDPRDISADYNILVFDADGNYLSGSHTDAASGIDNNFDTGEALEYAELPLNKDGSKTVYQLAITRASSKGANPASRLRYFAYTDGSVYGPYIHTGRPTLFGHSAAANADGVAAFDVHDTSKPEDFTSLGPVTILFDFNGNRLATPLTREQPTIAAVDGVNTTFFPAPAADNDSDGDGYPNFYGTSAAAPHAAGVAALLLQAAGGRGRLTAAQMRVLLESTATAHDLDPGSSKATFSSADGRYKATMTAHGDGSNNSAFDSQFFTFSYTGPVGSSLHKLYLDIGGEDEVFDPSAALGYPFTIGGAVGVDATGIKANLGVNNGLTDARLLLKLPRGNFPSGGSLSFGIDRDDASLKPPSGGNSADALAGTRVMAKFFQADGTAAKAVGTLVNKTGTGYSPDVGYGLINAEAALKKLQGK